MRLGLTLTLDRIAVAEEHAPVLVFLAREKGEYDVFYSKTVVGEQMLVKRSSSFVGAFHKNSDHQYVRRVLTTSSQLAA